MPYYRKKPIVIEAIQWTGFNTVEIRAFAEGVGLTIGLNYDDSNQYWLIVPTLEGTMRASIGDWIIKGVNGEFYPCKPDIFEKTYEACHQ